MVGGGGGGSGGRGRGRVGVGTVEVVDDALRAGGMAHQDDLLVLRGDGGVFGGFVLLDVMDGLGDLIGVAVQRARAPCLVGGGEVEGEEGPGGWVQGGDQVG